MGSWRYSVVCRGGWGGDGRAVQGGGFPSLLRISIRSWCCNAELIIGLFFFRWPGGPESRQAGGWRHGGIDRANRQVDRGGGEAKGWQRQSPPSIERTIAWHGMAWAGKATGGRAADEQGRPSPAATELGKSGPLSLLVAPAVEAERSASPKDGTST